MNMYFTADWHFSDTRLFLFPRPFKNTDDMAEHLIQNFNQIVNDDDVTFFLGDAALTEEGLKHVSKMNGRKLLIRGNYDTFDEALYLKYFESVQDTAQFTLINQDDGAPKELDVNLVHYPSKGVVDRFNLVGHIHGAWRVQKNMLNVGVDVWNYRPVSVKDVLFMYNAVNQFYDDDVWTAYDKHNMHHMARGRQGAAAKGTAK